MRPAVAGQSLTPQTRFRRRMVRTARLCYPSHQSECVRNHPLLLSLRRRLLSDCGLPARDGATSRDEDRRFRRKAADSTTSCLPTDKDKFARRLRGASAWGKRLVYSTGSPYKLQTITSTRLTFSYSSVRTNRKFPTSRDCGSGIRHACKTSCELPFVAP